MKIEIKKNDTGGLELLLSRTQRDCVADESMFHSQRAVAYIGLMRASNSESDFENWKSQALKHLDACGNWFKYPEDGWQVVPLPTEPNGTPALDAVGQQTTDTSGAITRDA